MPRSRAMPTLRSMCPTASRSRPSHRDPQRVQGVRHRAGGCAVCPRALRFAERALRPVERAAVVAAAEREPPHLLVEVGALDWFAFVLQQREALLERSKPSLALARVPVERADLAAEPGLRDALRAIFGGITH